MAKKPKTQYRPSLFQNLILKHKLNLISYKQVKNTINLSQNLDKPSIYIRKLVKFTKNVLY